MSQNPEVCIRGQLVGWWGSQALYYINLGSIAGEGTLFRF